MKKRDFLKTVLVGTAATSVARLAGAPGAPTRAADPAASDSDAPSGLRPVVHVCTQENAPWRNVPLPSRAGVSPGSKRGPDLRIGAETPTVWRGFGGCFNELGWRALGHLSDADRESALDRLFLPDGELCFEFCRLPIGANDFSEDWYSYDETPGDFDLTHFSIERDRQALIPYVRAALKRRPDLAFFASPWSPPAWLKVPPIFNGGHLNPDPRHRDTYARYLAAFVSAYAAEGIRIGQVHVQNEPTSSQKFPSCVMSGDEMRTFISRHLGPAFAAAGCPAEIWLGTLNGADNQANAPGNGFNDYAFAVLEDPEARRHVRGISYQWGGKTALARTRLAYPDVPVIQSENECGDGANTWRYAWHVADLFQHYLANDVSAYCYWNIVLEPHGESTWGWAQNSLLTVDPKKRSLTVNPEYHVMRHYSGFIRRGDHRCHCSSPWSANAVAYRRGGRDTAIVARNPFPDERSILIECGGEGWRASLPGTSLNTLVFS